MRVAQSLPSHFKPKQPKSSVAFSTNRLLKHTVQFAILDQSTNLWALPVAKLKGIPNNPSNKTLG